MKEKIVFFRYKILIYCKLQHFDSQNSAYTIIPCFNIYILVFLKHTPSSVI